MYFPSSAQIPDKAVDEWIRLLSIKNDARQAQFLKVYSELQQLDPNQKCDAIRSLELKSAGKNKRYRIRLTNLTASILLQHRCPDFENYSAEEQLKNSLRTAYEVEDSTLIAMLHESLGDVYTRKKDFGSALGHSIMANTIYDKVGPQHFNAVAQSRHKLGELLHRGREYALSINALREAIKGFNDHPAKKSDTLELHFKMTAWNTIGLDYEKLGQYDSAMVAFRQSLKIANTLRDKNWIAFIGGNMGEVHMHLGQYDTAKALLQQAVENNIEHTSWNNAANSLQQLARIHIKENNPLSALQDLNRAREYLLRFPDIAVQENIYFAYALAYQKLGKADSVFAYMQKYQSIHDTIEHQAADDHALFAKMRMENQESQHQISSLNKERKRIAFVRNIVIVIIIIASIMGMLFYKREKWWMQVREHQIMSEKNMAEKDAFSAKVQLQNFTKRISETTALAERLQEQLVKKELTEAQVNQIAELSRHSILTDEDWEEFKKLFDEVYPGFFIGLREKAPDITVAEQRVAALSKLKITPKAAANLLGISPASVNKTRQRLRYRLNLDADTDLEVYFTENTTF